MRKLVQIAALIILATILIYPPSRLAADDDQGTTKATDSKATNSKATNSKATGATSTTAMPTISKRLNIRYAKRRGVRPGLLSLDVYYPNVKPVSATSSPSSSISRPVLVMVHGGAWRIGDKRNASMTRFKVPHFVGKGYVYACINYRLSRHPGVKHPDHINDVAYALAWIHTNIATYGGDPNRLIVMGHSAGAHLAALIATDSSRLKAVGKSLNIIKGVICLDGAGYDIPAHVRDSKTSLVMRWMYRSAFGRDPAGWRNASPRLHVTQGKSIPPMLVLHTNRQGAIRASTQFVATLRAAGVPALAVLAPDKDHAGINWCIGTANDRYTSLVDRFLAKPQSVNSLRLMPVSVASKPIK